MKPLIVTFPLSLMFFFSCGSGHPDKRVNIVMMSMTGVPLMKIPPS